MANFIEPFKFWAQKVLPTEYDDSLSYYEVLCKLVDKLNNEVIISQNEIKIKFDELKAYVENYFNDLDVQDEINNKLDAMALDGTLTSLIAGYVDPYIEEQNQYNQETREMVIESNLQQQTYNEQTRAMIGTPLVASTKAQMTDTTKIYVYVGSGTGADSGMQYGYWYYYNGSDWAVGGEYNSEALVTDKTLSLPNKAADAKTTGDEIKSIVSFENVINTFLNSKSQNNSYQIPLTWESGAITYTNEELDLSTRIRTGYINIYAFNSFSISVNSGYSFTVLYYGNNKNYLGHGEWGSSPVATEFSGTRYLRLVLKRETDTEDISTVEGSNLVLAGYWKYPNISEANQFKKVINSVLNGASSNEYNIPITWETGGLHYGIDIDNANTIRSDYIDVFAFDNIVRTLNTGYSVYFAFYDENKQFRTNADWTTNSSVKYPLTTAKYVRLSLRKSDGVSSIQPSDGTNLTLIGYWKNSDLYPYLHGKKCLFMGDSISYGLYSYWDGNERKNSDGLNPDYAPIKISDYFAKLCGMSVDNIAARGTGYVADSRNLGNARAKAAVTDFSTYDFVALCFGINDYIQACPLGNIESKTEGTIIGNLCYVLEKIYTDNPLCKVVIYTPYNAWGQVAVNQQVETYYGNESTNYAMGYSNNAGYTLQEIISAIKSVGDYYGITCTGLGDSNIVNRINIKDIMIDGLHPSLESLPLLAAEMFAQKDFG